MTPESSADVSAFRDAAVLVRFAFCLCIGMMLVFGFAGGGLICMFYALFLGILGILLYVLLSLTRQMIGVKRVLSNNRAFEYDVARMRLRVENASPFTCFYTTVNDRFTPANRTRQLVPLRTPLYSRQCYELPLTYFCQAKRGCYRVGPGRLIIHDPLGIFHRSVSDSETYPFYVYPAPIQIPDFAFQAVASPYSFGMFQNTRTGSSPDFAGIREYHEWDDTRHIHWPATARLGRLVVREFHQSGAAEVTVFFDLNRASLCGIGRHSTTEYAIKVAGSVVKLALEEGHHVQLIAQSSERIYLPFASGVGHMAEIMQALALARVDGDTPLHDLVRRHVDAVPPGSRVAIIFSKCDIDVERYVEVIRVFHARGVHVTAIIIDHTSFIPMDDFHQYEEAGMAHDTLARQGVTVFFVQRGDDLSAALTQPLAVET
jgi:uncharacterized protein (DUF58 family)